MKFQTLIVGLLAVVVAVGGALSLPPSHAQAPVTPPGPPLVIVPVVPPAPAPTPAVDPQPTPDDLKPVFTIKASIGGEIIGDEVVTLPVGRLLVLEVQGVPGEGRPSIAWALNAPSTDVSVREGGWYVTFAAPVQGNWLFTAAVNNPDAVGPPLVAQRWVKVGHGPQPPPVVDPSVPQTPVEPDAPTPVEPTDPSKITAVTYVYEKDDGPVPSGVMVALDVLNRRGILATTFEDDTTDGDGDVPTQYAVALKAAKEKGDKPALVIQAGSTVKQVWHDVRTEDDVLEAVK
jgi:hypothetical protein